MRELAASGLATHKGIIRTCPSLCAPLYAREGIGHHFHALLCRVCHAKCGRREARQLSKHRLYDLSHRHHSANARRFRAQHEITLITRGRETHRPPPRSRAAVAALLLARVCRCNIVNVAESPRTTAAAKARSLTTAALPSCVKIACLRRWIARNSTTGNAKTAGRRFSLPSEIALPLSSRRLRRLVHCFPWRTSPSLPSAKRSGSKAGNWLSGCAKFTIESNTTILSSQFSKHWELRSSRVHRPTLRHR